MSNPSITSPVGTASGLVQPPVTDVVKLAPESMIAGTVPLLRGADALTVAYHAAAFALDTERVRVMAQAAGDRVHYLAAAASDFTGRESEKLRTRTGALLPPVLAAVTVPLGLTSEFVDGPQPVSETWLVRNPSP